MHIKKLLIHRYRSLESLEWSPDPGINCLIGPADSGKSTVLAALALLFSPRQAPQCSDFDFYRRKTGEGFEIEAIIGGVPEGAFGGTPVMQGWKDGGLLAEPDDDGAEAVFVIRVSAGDDLDLRYEVVEHGGGTQLFSSGNRRALPFARLTASEYGNRELRLGYGSLLTKALEAAELKAAIHQAAAGVTSNLTVPGTIEERLTKLKETFQKAGLPSNLALGLITPPDSSLSAMFGLMIGENPQEAIPLTYSGMGTRQNALFTLVSALTGSPAPIIVLDEPEIGLEPYRQRGIVARLRKIIGESGQAVLATHSRHILDALQPTETWRLGYDHKPTSLGGAALESIYRRAPDTFISALPLVAEGDTEAGFLEEMLNRKAKTEQGTDIATLGIRIVQGKNHETALTEADALINAGFKVGLFVDNETEYADRRKTLSENDACSFGSWPDGIKNIEAAVATYLPWGRLTDLVIQTASILDCRPESLYQQISSNLGSQTQENLEFMKAEHSEGDVRAAVARGMDEGKWFKSLKKSRWLASFLLEGGVPEEIQAVIDAFWVSLSARV